MALQLDINTSLTEITAPTVEPVSVEDVQLHSRIDSDDEAMMLRRLIKAARQYVETYTNRQLVTATYDYYLDSFPNVILLPKPPLSSVTTVKYQDANDAEQTLAATVYDVDDDAEPGRITLAYSQSWPTIRDEMQAVVIRYVAGYSTNSDPKAVPEGLRLVMLMLVDHWHKVRGPQVQARLQDVPMTADSLLWQFRVKEFA